MGDLFIEIKNDYFAIFNQLLQGGAVLKRIGQVEYQYNPRELVFEYRQMKLYRYCSKKKYSCHLPLLVVFAAINRPEILDLFPERSFLGELLEQGIDVYLLDWSEIHFSNDQLKFADYINPYLHRSIDFIATQSLSKVNLLGICQGGVISLCYAALKPEKIKNLILISTPIDFHTTDNPLTYLLTDLNTEKIMRLTKCIPGAALTQFFINLRPFEWIGKKYFRLINHLEEPSWLDKFIRIEKWLHDMPDQPAQALAEFIKYFYQENRLIKNQLMIDGERVTLGHLTLPILNVMAKEDNIVPMNATKILKKYISSTDYSQAFFKSGHIGLYVSHKVDKSLTKTIANWLRKRDG